jgi:hypothetical protein
MTTAAVVIGLVIAVVITWLSFTIFGKYPG